MTFNFNKATAAQLKTILLHEECSNDLKVQASREIMKRSANDAYKQLK